MSDQDIFQSKENQEVSSQPDQAPSVEQKPETSNENPVEDLLRSIVNENGEPKYKSVPDALNALKHSQDFIPTLKNENSIYKEQLQESQELLRKYEEALKTVDRLAKPQAMEESPPAPQADKEEAVDIDALVEQSIARRETQKQQEANAEKVINSLREKYGEKAGQAFYSKAEELGLDRETMNTLARKSPEAVLRYFQEDVKQSPPSPGSEPSSVRTESLQEKPKHYGPLPPPAKSIMAGASQAEVQAELQRHKQAVLDRLGIKQ